MSELIKAHFAGRDSRELIHVLLEREASRAEVEGVQRIFDDAGLPEAFYALADLVEEGTYFWDKERGGWKRI